MLHINHLAFGWITPVVPYAMSVVGSVLGLRCTTHARYSPRPAGWLVAAAIALGGCGIWAMHFTAMLGFAITGTYVRYDIPTTLLSAAIAVLVVWIGLSIVVRGRREILTLPLGGTLTGLGVTAMHYLGMYAMRTGAHIEYDPTLVETSIAIAVVAATTALWFILHIRGYLATFIAAAIMGAAVCGMHYTGMASMSVHRTNHPYTTPTGAHPIELLTPLITTVILVVMGLILIVGLAEITLPDRRGSICRSPEVGKRWPTKAVVNATSGATDAAPTPVAQPSTEQAEVSTDDAPAQCDDIQRSR